MPPLKIFISYSHEDEKHLAQLLDYLSPYEKSGILEVWTDKKLRPGDDFKAKIQEALDAANLGLCLLSQKFLISPFIQQVELPPLLGAAESGGKKFTWIFVEPCTAHDRVVTFRASTGSEVRLTRWQGLNTPSKALSEMDGPERKRAFVKMAKQLAELKSESLASAAESTSRAAIPDSEPLQKSSARRAARRTTADRPYRRSQLTIDLRVRDASIEIRYLGPHGQALHELVSSPISKLKFQLRSTVEPRGDHLYEFLFGNTGEDRAPTIVQALLGASAPTAPSTQNLRVRIATSDPELAALPWRRITYKSKPLTQSGWTFELCTPSADGALPIQTKQFLEVPCSTLLIDAAMGVGRHVDRLLDVLGAASRPGKNAPRDRTSVARTWEEVESALRSHPSIVAVVGQGVAIQGAPALSLPTRVGSPPETRALSWFADSWKQNPPKIALLKLSGLSYRDVVEAGRHLHPEVPLSIVQRFDGNSDGSPVSTAMDPIEIARDLLRQLLEPSEHSDPMRILCESEYHQLAAWTSYDHWKTAGRQEVTAEDLVVLLLDRKPQKIAAIGFRHELSTNAGQRVMALVGYGSEYNHAEELSKILHHHLAIVDKIHFLPLALPSIGPSPQFRDAEDRYQQFARRAARALGSDASTALGAALAGLPGSGNRNSIKIVFLDWGTFGNDPPAVGSTQRENWSAADLEDWVRFQRDELTYHCPDDMRFLSLVVLEKPAKHHRGVELAVKRLRSFQSAEFKLDLLPPLNWLDRQHLYEYFTSERGSRLEGLANLAADAVFAHTRGAFSHAVQVIIELHKLGWPADRLEQMLKAAHKDPASSQTVPPPKELEFE